MSDPSVDLEKGITGPKGEEKGICGLKEEAKVVRQFNHLKVMCAKRLLDVILWLNFVGVMFMALILYRRYHTWWPALVLSFFEILSFWNYRRMKHRYVQQALAGAEGDLHTTLLASSKKEANMPAS